jgi:hypothetical protein
MLDRTTLTPGLELPCFARQGEFEHWNRYAAVNYEFAGHHMDDEVGRSEGFPAAMGMAPLIFAYMHCLVRDWCEPEHGVVDSVRFKLRAPFVRHATLTARGVVKNTLALASGGLRVSLDIWAEDDAGSRLVEGRADVVLP